MKNKLILKNVSSTNNIMNNVMEPTQGPVPSWLIGLFGRVLHRYRRGQGFKSRTGLIFSSGLIFTAA